MIDIGKMGNSGRDAMRRILMDMEAAKGDSAEELRRQECACLAVGVSRHSPRTDAESDKS